MKSGLTFAEYIQGTNRNKKSSNMLQFEEWSSWWPLGIERLQSSLKIYIYSNFAFYCVWHFSSFLVNMSSLTNPKHCDHFLLQWYLWLVISLQQGWKLLLFHLALMSLSWFMHCCVWSDFKTTTIILALNENIPVLHVITIYHWAWRKGSSYSSLEWWWSSPKLLLLCL